jgi:hypothetical protein
MTKLRDGSLNIYAKGLFHAPPDDARLMAIELLQLRKQTRLIPVEEKLPEDCERCLVYMSNDYEVIASYFATKGAWKNDSGEYIANVTHWMPLPPAPEVEK